MALVTRHDVARVCGAAIAALMLLGCHETTDAGAEPRVADPRDTSVAEPREPPIVGSATPLSADVPADSTIAAAPPADVTPYPWHSDDSIEALPVVDSLAQRFEPPPGYRRVPVAEHSFGAWLRTLPLAANDTPVRSYDGRVLLTPRHQHLAAVSTLDIGAQDLQQCADAIMRLHAEWLWSNDRAREASYPTGAGDIPWTRYLAGDRPEPQGVSFTWRRRRAAQADHASYRRYLDVVFSWANTVSLARKASKPPRDEVRPGDFFILPGGPGHSVLLLDMARNDAGEIVALVGQSYMPAQSFHVVRPSRKQVWFKLHDEGVDTPFWRRFPWTALRRLD